MLNYEGLYLYSSCYENLVREISWLRNENLYLRKRIRREKRCYNCDMPGHLARACCRPSRSDCNWRTGNSYQTPVRIDAADTVTNSTSEIQETHDETVPDATFTSEQDLSTKIDNLRQWLKDCIQVTDCSYSGRSDDLSIEQDGTSWDQDDSCNSQQESEPPVVAATFTWMPETSSNMNHVTHEIVTDGDNSDTKNKNQGMEIKALRQWLQRNMEVTDRSDDFSIKQQGTSRDYKDHDDSGVQLEPIT